MGRTAARALWSTALAFGCVGAAVALLLSQAGSSRSTAVRPIDPGAPVRLATQPPHSAAAPTPLPASGPTPASRSGVRPVSVRIAAIDVTAPVTAVGVDRRGAVAIPERVATVGWYRFSAAPGAGAGSTVLVGHVDSAEQGKGAFFRLRDLKRGDRIVVAVAGGGSVAYRVVSLAQFPKTSVPLRQLFARSGTPRLTLITCGGSFDAARRSYRENIVVTAVPT
jgi:LPXTG-site transpeptidase (sortase) family protein